MARVGFAIYGYSIGHETVSNGLFDNFDLTGESYLSNNIKLSPGEQLVKISRDVINDREIVKIYCYDYAVANRTTGGGYVGYACIFMGRPTEKLLYNSMKVLCREANGLLNDKREFKYRNLDLSHLNLISPTTEGLINGNPRTINQPTDNNIYTLYTEGPVLEYLMAAVQGFMYNPNFRNLKSLYVSNSKSLLKKIQGNSESPLLRMGHLLNFHNHFTYQNQRLSKLKDEYKTGRNELVSRFKQTENKLQDKIENLENKIKVAAEALDKKDNEFQDLVKASEEERDVLENLEQEKKDFIKNYTKRKRELNNKYKLLEEQFTQFKQKIKDRGFEQEVSEFVKGHKIYQDLHDEKNRLQVELNRIHDNQISIKKKLLVWMFFILLLFGGMGYYLGNQFPIKSSKTEEISNEVVTDSEEENEKKSGIKVPDEMTAEQFFDLSESKQEEHYKKVGAFIDSIKNDDNIIDQETRDGLINRKWSFAELIDVNKFDADSVLAGLERMNLVENLYKDLGAPIDIFEKHLTEFALKGNIDEKHHDFETNSRSKIMMKYLYDENISNIYENLKTNIDESLFGNPNFDVHVEGETSSLDRNKRNALLVYMHFRWMIYKLNDTNLKTTINKGFRVKIVKE